MKKLPLWYWGVALIGGGIASGAIVRPTPGTMQSQGEAFGQGLAILLAILVGIGLIVAHFVRTGRTRKP